MLNKLVTEARGHCAHEFEKMTGTFIEKYYKCTKCGIEVGSRYTVQCRDYENDMDACMELWQELVKEYALDMYCYCGHWFIVEDVWLSKDIISKSHSFQLAIIRAYLKSKGVLKEPSK